MQPRVRTRTLKSATAVIAATVSGALIAAVPAQAVDATPSTPVNHTSVDARAAKKAPAVGKKCPKKNKTVRTAAGTFKCKKVGKKLLWKKIKTASAAPPASTPTPQPGAPSGPATPPAPPNTGPGSSAVSNGGQTTVTTGGVTVVASPGAIGAGQTLSITNAPGGTTVPDVPADQMAAGIFEVSTSQGQPTGPVTVTVPYNPAAIPAGDSPLILHEDTEIGMWAPEDTTVNPDGTLTATFDHFSLFSAAARTTWAVGVLTGNRSTETTDCAPTPNWVVNTQFTTTITESLLSCAGPGSTSDTLRVNLVNNRGYPMLLDVDGAGFAPEETWQSDSVAGGVSKSLGRVIHNGEPTKVALPAGSKATLVFHRPSGTDQNVTIDAVQGPATGPTQMAIRYAQKAVEAAAPVELVDCFGKIAYNGVAGVNGDLTVSAVAANAKTCSDMAKDNGGLGDRAFKFLNKVGKALFFVDSGQYIADNFVDAQFPPHTEFRMNESLAPDGGGWKQISTGGSHSCGVTTAGAARCWGGNQAGELGDGTYTDPDPNYLESVPVSGLGSNVASISAGGRHSCAVTTAGAAYCWGHNWRGQLGSGTRAATNVPIPVSGLGSDVASISAGTEHSCAVTTAGAAYCWGAVDDGRLGSVGGFDSWEPVPVSGLTSGVVSISAGYRHTCAVTTAGGAYCWGFNETGGLGNSTNTNSWNPVAVSGMGSGVASISAGLGWSCAVTTSGAAYCWGENYNGTLGNGTTTSSNVPVAVSGLGSGVAAIDSGGHSSCAVTTAGGVYCWGYNIIYESGHGKGSNVPLSMSGSGFASISVDENACAVTRVGTAKCWGFVEYSPVAVRDPV